MKQRKKRESKPATARTPFFIGQRSDRCGNGVLDVMRRTGRTRTRKPVHLTKDVIKDPIKQRMEIRVLWELSCGTKLTFQRGKGPDPEHYAGDRIVAFRVVEIELEDGTRMGGAR